MRERERGIIICWYRRIDMSSLFVAEWLRLNELWNDISSRYTYVHAGEPIWPHLHTYIHVHNSQSWPPHQAIVAGHKTINEGLKIMVHSFIFMYKNGVFPKNVPRNNFSRDFSYKNYFLGRFLEKNFQIPFLYTKMKVCHRYFEPFIYFARYYFTSESD